MEIRLPVRVSTTSPLQTEAQALKLGDILRAVVETRLKDNAFQLRLDSGGRALVAYSGANLKPGQILELEVVKLETTPELRILPRSTELPASDSTVQQALRLFLPKQKPSPTSSRNFSSWPPKPGNRPRCPPLSRRLWKASWPPSRENPT